MGCAIRLKWLPTRPATVCPQSDSNRHCAILRTVKHFHHTVVGNLERAYESVDMISDPGLSLTIYVAEPASPTAHALELLASWRSATAEHDNTISTWSEMRAHPVVVRTGSNPDQRI